MKKITIALTALLVFAIASGATAAEKTSIKVIDRHIDSHKFKKGPGLYQESVTETIVYCIDGNVFVSQKIPAGAVAILPLNTACDEYGKKN